MRKRDQTAAAIFSCFLATALGCNSVPPMEVAPQGANPPLTTNIGPVPGPVEQGAQSGFASVNTQPSNPYANDPIAYTEGRRLFLWYNCYGCHGGRAGGGMGPSLRDSVWLFGDSDAQIFSSIAQGRGEGMPAWGSRIPEDQIWKLVAYIKTLNTPQEPDPPTR